MQDALTCFLHITITQSNPINILFFFQFSTTFFFFFLCGGVVWSMSMFCYLAAFNWWLIMCPLTLSHDWQMGSIPVVDTFSDTRNILTIWAFGSTMLMAYKSWLDFEVNIVCVLTFARNNNSYYYYNNNGWKSKCYNIKGDVRWTWCHIDGLHKLLILINSFPSLALFLFSLVSSL